MDPRYPIGFIEDVQQRDASMLREYVRRYRDNASDLQALISGLPVKALERRYRPGSFTIRQLAHHVADAHEQGFMRFRWGLSHETPAILTMNEAVWATYADYALAPDVSLHLFASVNERWVTVLSALDTECLARTILHPSEGPHDLWQLLAKHDWHVRHHMAHVRLALTLH